MKNIFIMLSISILFFGCTKDWGNPATRNYPVNAPYTKLDVSNAFEVTVSDQVTDVVVTVGELAQERVVVRVVDGELQIGFKPNTFGFQPNCKAVAVIPANANLSDLELSGASSFTGDLRGADVDIDLSGASTYRGTVEATELNLELSGASSFTGDLRGADVDIDLSGASTYRGTIEATELNLDLSGASDAIISGVCQTKMDIDLSGASTLKAADLSAMSVSGEMSGASDADVTVCSALNVELSGASTLTYGTSSEDCHPNVNCPASGGSVVKPR